MKKKLITMLLSLSMLLGVGGLAACDKDSSSASTESSSPTGDSSSGGGDSSSSSGSGDSSGSGIGFGGGSGGGESPSITPGATKGLAYELSSDETYYTVTGIGTITSTDIDIPATYNSIPVTKIGDYAFSGCSSLTSITIPDSVTYIGESAFSGCSGITQKENGVYYVDKWVVDCDDTVGAVHFRADTRGILPQAFTNNDKLESIVIPDSVIFLGGYAFSYCDNLVSAVIGTGVTNIWNGVFRECTKLESVTIPEGVTYIGSSVFASCSSLTSITLPDSLTQLENTAFQGCSRLMQIDDKVTYADKWVISCDTSATSINLRITTKGIANGAFNDCDSLESITIEEGNTVYASQEGILYNKDKTKIKYVPKRIRGAITLPNGIKSIGSSFYWCDEITRITIPETVTYIAGGVVFGGCRSLMEVIFENPNGWKAGSTAISASDLQNPTTAANYLKGSYAFSAWTRVDE